MRQHETERGRETRLAADRLCRQWQSEKQQEARLDHVVSVCVCPCNVHFIDVVTCAALFHLMPINFTASLLLSV